MKTPIRILRAAIENADRDRPEPTARAIARRDRIIANATILIAGNTLLGLSMAGIAAALDLGAGAVRRIFPDLFCIVADIIQRDLQRISDALVEIPHDAENRPLLLALAYWRATRGNFGALTDAHRITVRDRQFLPDDLREPLERCRQTLGDIIAPGRGHKILAMLDTEEFEQHDLEALFPALPSHAPPPPDIALSRPETTPPPAPAALPTPATLPAPAPVLARSLALEAKKRAIDAITLPAFVPGTPTEFSSFRPAPPRSATQSPGAMLEGIRARLVALTDTEATNRRPGRECQFEKIMKPPMDTDGHR